MLIKRWWSDLLTNGLLRARSRWAPESTLWQLCDDASNTVLIETNGVTPEWGCNPFLSNSIVFNENSITSVIKELSQHWADRCKRALTVSKIRFFHYTMITRQLEINVVSVFRIRFFLSVWLYKPRVNVKRNVRGVNGFGEVPAMISVVQHAALPVLLHRFRVQILHHVNSTARANLQNAKEYTRIYRFIKKKTTKTFQGSSAQSFLW